MKHFMQRCLYSIKCEVHHEVQSLAGYRLYKGYLAKLILLTENVECIIDRGVYSYHASAVLLSVG